MASNPLDAAILMGCPTQPPLRAKGHEIWASQFRIAAYIYLAKEDFTLSLGFRCIRRGNEENSPADFLFVYRPPQV